MQLVFRCPQTRKTFRSGHYRLLTGHRIAQNADGERELQGEVALTDPCPECGRTHVFRVSEVLCPLTRGEP